MTSEEGEDKWEREINLEGDFWFVRDRPSRQIEGTIPKKFM